MTIRDPLHSVDSFDDYNVSFCKSAALCAACRTEVIDSFSDYNQIINKCSIESD